MNGVVVKDAKNDWYEQRRRIQALIGYLESGKIEFLGTKAEAKRVYGNWRKL